MGDSNKAKAAQLGMPLGTAAGKLRKAVLFNVLRRHGEAVCFRCQQEIASADDLSIEHKRPWLHVDAALFWDVENVAFSHLRCNRPNRPFDLGSVNRVKTRCPYGHEYTPTNTVLQGARKARVCRECKTHSERRRKAKRAAAGAATGPTNSRVDPC